MSIANMIQQANLGAVYIEKRNCGFTVWAPLLKRVVVKIVSPEPRLIPMKQISRGYWTAVAENLFPGARYVYGLDDDRDRPDPASRFQPEGVHGPSEVVDPDEFPWEDDAWTGIPPYDYILYEIHIGAFTPEGTFEAAISRLDYLKDLGVTAIEIMPVAQFPGGRNWGYDGVYPFAPQNSYGGPRGLKSLVNACHGKGLAVILDVVYNHLGPDGNYLNDFAPYFTAKYKTPWGDAVNFDGPYSDEVRHYFVENALHWVTEYHMDGLRLDAIDTLYDFGAKHFLNELAEAVHDQALRLGRRVSVIAESDLNDVRVINPVKIGGYGVDAQWSDDFHHSLHSLVTGERKGYYVDFGKIEHMEKAFREGFVYSGQYSLYRKRRHGSSSAERPATQFVVCAQNHDQIGNRMLGDRLSSIVSFEQLKLAAGCVILSPFIPLLFMGEEYGETSPFQYFVSHIDGPLIEAIRNGRTREFAHFQWQGDVPDPQDEKTFLRSKINPALRAEGFHHTLFRYYKMLFQLRRTIPALSRLSKEAIEVRGYDEEQVLLAARRNEGSPVLIFYSFNNAPTIITVSVPQGTWRKLLDSSSREWGGTGGKTGDEIAGGKDASFRINGHSVLVYELQRERTR
jgi:maltooligosyltrehalose trehalohydrolase